MVWACFCLADGPGSTAASGVTAMLDRSLLTGLGRLRGPAAEPVAEEVPRAGR